MKSNRNPDDPTSNRKGGKPYWEHMQGNKKPAAPAKKSPPKPTKPTPTEAQEQGWDQVAKWYDRLVGNDGSDYHKHVIIPAVMALLPAIRGARVLDVCCGQGFVGNLLAKNGCATYHGIDASPQLIASAKKRCKAEPHTTFQVADACAPGTWADGTYDYVLNLMAVHDVADLPDLCRNIGNALSPEGRAIMVFMHPCFRIPKHTHWGWDEKDRIQYRRIDSYGSARKISITTHPGQKTSESTTFYHRPLPAYFEAIHKGGMVVTTCQELFSHRRSQTGGSRSKAEHFATEQFPMFLLLEMRKA